MGERLVDAQRNSKLLGGVNSFQNVAVPTKAAAAAASRISKDASVVYLDAQNNANDRAYLPDPATVPLGKVYVLNTDATGCELSTEGVGTKINGEICTDASTGAFAKELALAGSKTFIAVKVAANEWSVAPGAAAPDAEE